MRFKAEEISDLTFPISPVSGYSKKDVDDFLRNVTKDYKNFELSIQEYKDNLMLLEDENTLLEERLNAAKIKYKEERKRILEREQQSQELNYYENRTLSNENLNQELTVSQKIAFSLIKEAKQEATRIYEEADRYYLEKKADSKKAVENILSNATNQKRELEHTKLKMIEQLNETTEKVVYFYNQMEEDYKKVILNFKEDKEQ
ncbi:DivIVA domain-containing protein [Enterococcus gilvus]|uniref:DivIVA domain-containing protein n=1 Tax=Enterococcus gilvus TaxID=160453 RepID=UPI0029095865|nr:DivIVA domain-containing protein [Enterococcus gilvus]MDU5512417.1 DivIVA domain-containing protein [Enterococcus gilvus]